MVIKMTVSEKPGHPSSLQLCSPEPRKENNTMLAKLYHNTKIIQTTEQKNEQFIYPKLNTQGGVMGELDFTSSTTERCPVRMIKKHKTLAVLESMFP